MALVVAKLVKKIESSSKKTLKEFGLAYTQRYLLEAKKVAKLNIKITPTENPLFLSKLCHDLIKDVPDGGSTPQVVVGFLMDSFNKGNGSKIETTGHLDSVSATNTTSKKAGDIMEEYSDGTKRIYEVTVKSFSTDRMIESYEAVRSYDKENKITEVYVICNKKDVPGDVTKDSSTSYLLGHSRYQDLIYYFIDINEWILEKLLFMSPKSRTEFYGELIAHMNHINTSEKVKRYLGEWHQAHSAQVA
jgi:hypothetical protein